MMNIDYQTRLAQAKAMMANGGDVALSVARGSMAVPLAVGGGMVAYDAMTGEDQTSIGGYAGGGLGASVGMSGGSGIIGGAGALVGGSLGAALGVGASLASRGRIPMDISKVAGAVAGGTLGGAAGSIYGGFHGARGGYQMGEGLGDRANALLNQHLGL